MLERIVAAAILLTAILGLAYFGQDSEASDPTTAPADDAWAPPAEPAAPEEPEERSFLGGILTPERAKETPAEEPRETPVRETPPAEEAPPVVEEPAAPVEPAPPAEEAPVEEPPVAEPVAESPPEPEAQPEPEPEDEGGGLLDLPL